MVTFDTIAIFVDNRSHIINRLHLSFMEKNEMLDIIATLGRSFTELFSISFAAESMTQTNYCTGMFTRKSHT